MGKPLEALEYSINIMLERLIWIGRSGWFGYSKGKSKDVIKRKGAIKGTIKCRGNGKCVVNSKGTIVDIHTYQRFSLSTDRAIQVWWVQGVDFGHSWHDDSGRFPHFHLDNWC